MAQEAVDLESQLDRVYAAPLSGFVEARNALAKSLGASGRADDAARVKALKKPSAAAWAVNQLAFSSPDVLSALVASADRLRAQPSDVKEAMRARRDAVNEAVQAAGRALASAGIGANPDVLRRISATLEAVATFGRAPGAPVVGRLTEDVNAPGFDEIASLGLLALDAAPRVATAPERPLASEAKKDPAPGKPSARDLERERAAEEKRRHEEAARLAASLRKSAEEARARLAAAEKTLAAARQSRAALGEQLARAEAEEARLAAALEEARAASEAADDAAAAAARDAL